MITAPNSPEYHPYFDHYIKLVPQGPFLSVLDQNTQFLIDFLKKIPEKKYDFAYKPGKWTLKQVLLHLNDTERVFQYRALLCARGDLNTLIPMMDENMYMQNVAIKTRDFKDLIIEFKSIRASTSHLFQHINPTEAAQINRAAAERPFSARALGFCIIGHINHHINIMKERYL